MTANAPDEYRQIKDGLLSEGIASDLRNGILAGAFLPGARIRQDELAARYGASRIPVREALRQLENEGLVVLVPNSGAWIAKLDLRECIEVYKIRERLEPLALQESIASLTAADIAELSALAARMEANTEVDEFLRLDRDFHSLCYKGSGMPDLSKIIKRFWNRSQHYRRAYSNLIGQEGLWIVHYEHRLIVEAIRRRDATDASHLLWGHIRRTRLELEQHKELF
jgi:DNA-binding GntR family transcriptional regulator